MMTDAELVAAPAPATTALADADERGREYIQQAKAANTIRGYQSDWRHFSAWCEAHYLTALPAAADTVAHYLAELADTHKPSTLARRVSAISQAHQIAGHATPTDTDAVRLVMAGIRRAKGTAPTTKAPALTDDIRAMIAAMDDSLVATRDRALLLVGFAGAFRRSQLVSLNRKVVETTRDGLVATLRRSNCVPGAWPTRRSMGPEARDGVGWSGV
jgi:site-specific recombinase XerD